MAALHTASSVVDLLNSHWIRVQYLMPKTTNLQVSNTIIIDRMVCNVAILADVETNRRLKGKPESERAG